MPTNGDAFVLTIRYTYWCGVLTGDEGSSSGTHGQTTWVYHHNVIDHRIPILWSAYQNSTRVTKVTINPLYTAPHGTVRQHPGSREPIAITR